MDHSFENTCCVSISTSSLYLRSKKRPMERKENSHLLYRHNLIHLETYVTQILAFIAASIVHEMVSFSLFPLCRPRRLHSSLSLSCTRIASLDLCFTSIPTKETEVNKRDRPVTLIVNGLQRGKATQCIFS